jgi:acyl-CoA thioester hydrolase
MSRSRREATSSHPHERRFGRRASVELSTRVEWIDTDAAGIYHNSSVLRWVESAEAELMRACCIEGYVPVAPRVRFEVDFTAPLFFGQEVTVTLTVTRVGETSLTLGFEIWGRHSTPYPSSRRHGFVRDGAPLRRARRRRLQPAVAASMG